MAFSLKNYIIKNMINGFEDGTFTESKVMQLAIGYLTKGLLTEEDIAQIDEKIAAIIAEREAAAAAQEAQEAEYEEVADEVMDPVDEEEEPEEEDPEEDMPTPVDNDKDE